MPEYYVLDACSLIAFFRNEKGEEVVSDLFYKATTGKAILFLHKITMTEVIYDRLRTEKSRSVSQLIADIYRLPISEADILDDDFIGRAATYKATHKISFADSFVLALAETHNATVVSSDHHEFDPIAQTGILSFHWIR